MTDIVYIFLFYFFADIIGSITLLIVKGDEEVGKYREEMRALQGYATMHALPQDLRDSMQRHLKLHFYNSSAADEAVLKAYPSSIRRRVLRQLYLPTLRQCYLFTGAKQRFLDALLAVSRVELYLPQVEIVSQGDYVNELFILVAGRVICYNYQGTGENPNGALGHSSTMLPSVLARPSDGLRSAYSTQTEETSLYDGNSMYFEGSTRGGVASTTAIILNEGDVFGEVAFFTGTAQAETVRTLSTTRVLAISKAVFEQIVAKFPTSHRIVLSHLARHGEDVALEQFNGPNGFELFQKAISEEGRMIRRGFSALPGHDHADFGNFTGGDPQWRLAPGHAAMLRLTPQQEQAVGALLQVRGVVARVVAEHDADQTNEWLNAAARGDTSKIREILTHGFDPNSHDFDYRTALMLASSRGFGDVIEVLLSVGADTNLIDTFGNSALMEACKGGHDDVIDALRKAKARLGCEGMKEGNMLCTVVHESDLKLLRRLLRAGANPNAGDYDGRTALHVAASEGNLPAVEILVTEGGASTDTKDRWGNTPVDEAAKSGSKAVEIFLIAQVEELNRPEKVETEGVEADAKEEVIQPHVEDEEVGEDVEEDGEGEGMDEGESLPYLPFRSSLV